jgi:NAD(P)-dependent dehydrogenase (short-subunit alcohol dehydrogenase family)
MDSRQIVLVTGASSGIGKAAAELFAKSGYVVYGTSRHGRYETIGPQGAAFTLLPMTLQDETTVQAAVKYVLSRHSRIDILVNAAGSGIAGAVEETSADEAREQFDVLFFGNIRVLNYVLPAMRAAGRGLVINVGSVASFFPLPFQGMYSAAKAALFSMTCALRVEMKPFGVKCCQIEPGDAKTNFTARRVLTKKSRNTAYGASFLRALYEIERSEMAGKDPAHYAEAIVKAARMKNPPARICPDFQYRALRVFSSILPWRAFEKVIAAMYLTKDPPHGWDLKHCIGGQQYYGRIESHHGTAQLPCISGPSGVGRDHRSAAQSGHGRAVSDELSAVGVSGDAGPREKGRDVGAGHLLEHAEKSAARHTDHG